MLYNRRGFIREYLFGLWHFEVKRRICRVHVNYLRNVKEGLYIGGMSYEEYVRFHQMSTISDNGVDSPELTHMILSDLQRIKFVKERVKSLLDKQKPYLSFTRNRLMPEDIYELCLWRRELDRIGWKPKPQNVRVSRSVHFQDQ
jgi:hypothetical protein